MCQKRDEYDNFMCQKRDRIILLYQKNIQEYKIKNKNSTKCKMKLVQNVK